jgi:hypothetical protein
MTEHPNTPEAFELADLHLRREESVSATTATLYELLSDVNAMSAWSPDLVWARYDQGHGPRVGDWFTGHNAGPKGEWETRCTITEAVPGACFGWAVIVDGAPIGQWTYDLHAGDDGTRVTASWRVHNWVPILGTTLEELLALRAHTAASMERTLAALTSSVRERPTPR